MKIKERTFPIGIVTIRRHPAGTIEKIQALHAAGLHKEANELLHKGEIATRHHNLIVFSSNCGYDVLVQFLCSGYNGVFNFPLGIQWGEIGTGQTAPANNDIALMTPTNRMPVSFAMDNGFSTAQLYFYFPDAILANQMYYEFGMFIGGSSAIGSGNMFNHCLFTVPYSKSSGSDTTCECDISFQPASAAQFDTGEFS
jgi:hypothetical protein